MIYQINKQLLLESAEEIPKLNQLLNKYAKDLKKNKINTYLLIASDKNHSLGGGSVVSYGPKNKQPDPVIILDKQFKKWNKYRT